MRNLHPLDFSFPLVWVDRSLDHLMIFVVLLKSWLYLLFDKFGDVIIVRNIGIHVGHVCDLLVAFHVLTIVIFFFFLTLWNNWLLESEM